MNTSINFSVVPLDIPLFFLFHESKIISGIPPEDFKVLYPEVLPRISSEFYLGICQ